MKLCRTPVVAAIPLAGCLLALLGCASPVPDPDPAPQATPEAEPTVAELLEACETTRSLDPCTRFVAAGRREDAEWVDRELSRLQHDLPDFWIPAFFLGRAEYRDDNYDGAREYFLEAERLASAAGDQEGLAVTSFFMSGVWKKLNRPELIDPTLDTALGHARTAGNHRILTSVLYDISRRHQERAEYERESEILDELIGLSDGDLAERSVRLYTYQRGQVARRLGRHSEAEEFYQAAIDASIRHDDHRRLAYASTALGYLELVQDHHDDALARLLQARDAAAAADQAEQVINASILIATALHRVGRLEEAETELVRLADRTAETPSYEARRRLRLAEVRRDRGEVEAAIDLFAEAEQLSEEAGRPVERLESRAYRADCLREAGRIEEAIETAESACSLVESSREGIDELTLRTHYLHTRSDVFQILAASLAALPEREASVFDAIERAHSKTLFDEFSRRGWQAERLALGDVQARLAPGDLLVEYLLGERRSTLALVTAGAAEIVELPARRELEAGLAAYLDGLHRPIHSLDARLDPAADFQRFVEPGLRLREMLMGDREELFARSTRWIIVPDRRIHALPFEALPWGTGEEGIRFAGERVAIVYLPAASLLAAEATPQGTAVVVGAPAGGVSEGLAPLAHANDEVEAVLASYETGTAVGLVGEAATLPALVGAVEGGAATLHLVAHATLDARRGPRIHLGAGDANTLDATALEAWSRAPDLAVLSACHSAQGEIVGGEGVLGLARAFRLAGTRQVVGSLWQADDRSTAELMQVFHDQLNRGKTPSLALLEARRATLRDGFVHPFFWSAFVLYGLG